MSTGVGGGVIDSDRRISTGAVADLANRVDGDLANLRPQIVVQAAFEADSLARSVIEWASYNLGVGVTNVTQLFDPSVVIIGGGAASAWNLIEPTTNRAIRERALETYAGRIRVVRSELGDDANCLAPLLWHFGDHRSGKEILDGPATRLDADSTSHVGEPSDFVIASIEPRR